MAVLNALLLVLLIVAVTAALPFLTAVWKLTQTVWQVTDVKPAHLKDCPPDWQQPIQTLLATCQGLGFEVVGYDWHSSGSATEPLQWGVVLQTPTGEIYLTVVVNPAPTAQPALLDNFYTYFTDGTSLTTTNQKPWSSFKPNPKRALLYLEGNSIEALYAKHCQALAHLKSKKNPLGLPAEKFAQTWKRNYLDDLDYLAQTKAIDWVQLRKSYRLGFFSAVQLTWSRRYAQSQKPARPTQPQPPASLEQPTHSESTPQPEKISAQDMLLNQQVAAFFTAKHLQEPSQAQSLVMRLVVLSLSIGAFFIILSPQASPRLLLFFVAALLLHEAGHVAAMWLSGYKNTSMLFIPYVGLLTTARKDYASLTERFWIYLAGPMSGLLLGVYLGFQEMQVNANISEWLTQWNWQREACVTLVFINLLNLLPIYPLDGGQIVNLLLFSKNAYLGFCFQGLGVLWLFLIGLNQPLFLVFAALIAINMPMTWRMVRTHNQLHQPLRHADARQQETFIRSVFRQFQQAPYQHWPMQKQQTIAKKLLESHREYHAPWSSRLGLMGLYLLISLISLSVVIAGFIPAIVQSATSNSRDEVSLFVRERFQAQFRKQLEAEQQRQEKDWQDLNQEIARNPQNANAYFRRAEVYLEHENYQAALADVSYSIHLNSQSIEGYKLRIRIYSKLGDEANAMADQQKISELYWQRRRDSRN
jgi:Zn-dependent protease